jgi:hypothetical protein
LESNNSSYARWKILSDIMNNKFQIFWTSRGRHRGEKLLLLISCDLLS